MPDQPKPRAALHSAVPEKVREFVRCRLDSVDIAPRELDLPGLPTFTLSFEAGADGSITILLDGPGDFFDSSISVSIQNGHVVADTSNVKFGREVVDKWIKDFNADIDAPPARQLSSVSIVNGKLHVAKTPVVAGTEPPPMAVPPPPAHMTDPIPGRTPRTPVPDMDPLPPPEIVESEEVVTATDSIPDLTDLGTDAESGTETDGEQEPEMGFIEEPPKSDEGTRRKGYVKTVGYGALVVATFFLFTNLRGDDAPETPPSDQQVESVADPEPEPAADDQTSEEPAPDEEPVSSSKGSDPQGDGKNGESETVTAEEDVPGADIKSVRHERGPSGEHWFFIVVYGDGETTATDEANDYLIDVEIRGSDGWGTRVQFNNGVAEPGTVRLGEKTSGRATLEGAEVSVEWVDDNTMKITVAGTGTDLNVGAFDVEINVFFSGGSFYDHAEGIAET